MNFSPDQVQAAMDKASPSYAALSTDPERQRADAQIRSAQIAAMRDPSYAGSPEARRAGLGLANRFRTLLTGCLSCLTQQLLQIWTRSLLPPTIVLVGLLGGVARRSSTCRKAG